MFNKVDIDVYVIISIYYRTRFNSIIHLQFNAELLLKCIICVKGTQWFYMYKLNNSVSRSNNIISNNIIYCFLTNVLKIDTGEKSQDLYFAEIINVYIIVYGCLTY